MARLNVSIDSTAAEAGAGRVNRALDSMRAGADRTLSAFRQIGDRLRGSFDRLRRAVFSLQGAFAAIGVTLTAKAFIDAASTSEQYRVRLERLLGSVKEGARMFDEMAAFAAKSTFEFEEIMGAATALAGVMRGGVDEVKQWMPIISDLAAVTGLGIQEATGQVIRMYSAGASAADMFREKGILAMLGFTAGVTYSAEETRQKLIEAYEDPFSKFRGASLALATTWQGVTGMLADLWFAFRNKVMEGGLFDYLKALATVIKDRLAAALQGGDVAYESFANKVIDTFENILLGAAGAWDRLKPVFTQIAGAFNSIIAGFNTLPTWAQSTGIVGAMLFGMKGVAILALLSQVAGDTKTTIEWFNAYMDGQISRVEYFTTFGEEAAKRLAELKAQAGATGEGPIKLGEIIVTPTGDAQAGLIAFFDEVRAKQAAIAAGGNDAANAIGAGADQAKRLAAEIEQAKKEAEALAESADDIQSIMDRLDPLGARMREFERERALLQQGHMQVMPGLETGADYNIALAKLIAERDADLQQLKESADSAADALETFGYQSVSAAEDVSGALQRWGDDFNETLTQSLMHTRLEVGDLLRAIEADIVRMTLRQTITNPLMTYISTAIGGAFAGAGGATPAGHIDVGGGLYAQLPVAGTYHRGGVVGVDRLPRYHNGLMPDEQLAVLQRGEGVFTRGQMRALGAGAANPPVIVNVHPPADTRAEVRQTQTGDGQMQIDVFIEQVEKRIGGNIRNGGGLSPALESTYGLNRGRGAIA